MNRADHSSENLSESQGKVVKDFMYAWHTVTYIDPLLTGLVISFYLTDNKETPKKRRAIILITTNNNNEKQQ